MNVDGSRQIRGTHYDETYAPVVRWPPIRLLLILATIKKWHTKQIDFVQEFPQAPVERELFMKVSAGVKLKQGKKSDCVLKVHKNIYGQKQAGRVWFEYLTEKLFEIGFKQSKHDACLFYIGKVLYALYKDDSILTGPSKSELDQVFHDLRNQKLDVTEEGDLSDFLGINIQRVEGGKLKFSQPQLIEQILEMTRITTRTTKVSQHQDNQHNNQT